MKKRNLFMMLTYLFLMVGTLQAQLRLDVEGDAKISGTITANKFIGDGSMLTGISGGGASPWTVNGANINRGSGNVGIGVPAPATPLSIMGNGGTLPVGITQKHVAGAGTATMEFTTADADGDQTTRLLLRGDLDGGDIEFYRGARNSEVRSVHIEGDNGNVGIGTTTPAEKLEVVGNVKANEIIGYSLDIRSNFAATSRIEGRLELVSNDDNIFIGLSAGKLSRFTTARRNTFLGSNAGIWNNFGQENTFIGYGAGLVNRTANNNTFVGSAAGRQNSTGDQNTIIGCYSLGEPLPDISETTDMGDNNTLMGFRAGNRVESFGMENTFIGSLAGAATTTGQGNTFVGFQAGNENIIGSNLEAFGANAQPVDNELQNSFTIGSNSLILKSNSGVLGNVTMQNIGGYVNWGTASDGRMKKNIKENIQGLDFILALRPVSYQIDALKLDKSLRAGMKEPSNSRNSAISDSDKRELAAAKKVYKRYLAEKSKIRYTGFIAQEVEKATETTGFEFSGLVKPSHSKDHYSLRYAEFTVPLVKAVQEQQEVIEQQKNKIEKLENVVQNQQSQFNELKSLVEKLLAQNEENPTGGNHEFQLKKAPSLNQNQPNPFRENTLVHYFIPDNAKNAHIQVTSVDGKVLGRVNIQEKGQGQVTIKAATYPAGTYYYSLIVDGEVFETKRMVLTK